MAKKIGHLDEQQIIEAVIDEKGLDAGLRRHLFECPSCHAEKEALRAGWLASVRFHVKGRLSISGNRRYPNWGPACSKRCGKSPLTRIWRGFRFDSGPSSEPIDTQQGEDLYA